MSNNNDKKIKRRIQGLRRMYWIVGGLTGLFTLLVLSFFVIIVISTSSKPASFETSALVTTKITPQTEVFVYEVCQKTGQRYENLEMIEEIRNLQNTTRQGLHTYLISRGKSIDVVEEFTSNRVVIEYGIEECEICLDDSLYMGVEGNKLVFYQGIPNENNKIGTIDEIIIIDIKHKDELQKGIKVNENDLYLGIHKGMSLAVYSGTPNDIKTPLLIFSELKVRADLILFLEEEEPFRSMEELLDLIESYGR